MTRDEMLAAELYPELQTGNMRFRASEVLEVIHVSNFSVNLQQGDKDNSIQKI